MFRGLHFGLLLLCGVLGEGTEQDLGDFDPKTGVSRNAPRSCSAGRVMKDCGRNCVPTCAVRAGHTSLRWPSVTELLTHCFAEPSADQL
jgi:hypothetical protein